MESLSRDVIESIESVLKSDFIRGYIVYILFIAGMLFAGLLWIVFGRFFSSRYDVPAIVLSHYSFPRRSESGEMLEISGRRRGLLSFLLSLLGWDFKVRFTISGYAIRREHEEGGWTYVDEVPIPNAASTHFAYTNSGLYLILAVIVGILGVGAVLVSIIVVTSRPQPGATAIYLPLATVGGTFLLVVFLLWAYFLSKQVIICVETTGGRVIGIQFNRGLFGSHSIFDSNRVRMEDTHQVGSFISELCARGR